MLFGCLFLLYKKSKGNEGLIETVASGDKEVWGFVLKSCFLEEHV